MAKDNTLGAPTEGLGQTVTFTAKGGVGVSQAQGPQRQSMRLSAQGGGAQLTARALEVPPSQADPTMAALFKLGGEILKPHIEQARTAAYVQGIQKAAQGQAITEIVDEQPWYSKLFGSTSLVDGARAYTANATAVSVATDMEANMGSLRKLSPAEFSQYATQAITKHQTGDATTDMMLSQQISSTLPSVMKGQAKAHLRYQQELFENSLKSAQTAAFANLGTVAAESRKPGATKESADVLGAAISTLSVLEAPPDMQPELHNGLLVTSAQQAIASGNFDVYRLLEDSGKLAKFSPAQADSLRRAYDRAASKAKLSLPIEFADKISDFLVSDNDPTNTPEKLKATAEQLNEEYTRLTGDDHPYLDVGAIGRGLAWLRLAQQREKEKQLAKLEREREKAQTTALSQQADEMSIYQTAQWIGTGQYVGDLPAKELRAGWQKAKSLLGDTPEGRDKLAKLRVVQSAQDAPDVVYKSKVQAQVLQAAASRNAAELYNVYQNEFIPLLKHGGEREALSYMGKGARVMEEYHKLAAGKNLGPNEILAIGGVASLESEKAPEQAPNKEVVKYLKSYGVIDKLTSEKFPIKDPSGLASVIYTRKGLDTKEAADIAIREAEQAGRLSVVAGYHWTKAPGFKDIKDDLRKTIVGGKMAIPNGELNQAFNHAVSEQAKAVGITSEVRIVQIEDKDGEARLSIIGADKNQNLVHSQLTPTMIRSMWEEQHKSWFPTQPSTPNKGAKSPNAIAADLRIDPVTLLPIK